MENIHKLSSYYDGANRNGCWQRVETMWIIKSDHNLAQAMITSLNFLGTIAWWIVCNPRNCTPHSIVSWTCTLMKVSWQAMDFDRICSIRSGLGSYKSILKIIKFGEDLKYYFGWYKKIITLVFTTSKPDKPFQETFPARLDLSNPIRYCSPANKKHTCRRTRLTTSQLAVRLQLGSHPPVLFLHHYCVSSICTETENSHLHNATDDVVCPVEVSRVNKTQHYWHILQSLFWLGRLQQQQCHAPAR